jgi:hypothetical protein
MVAKEQCTYCERWFSRGHILDTHEGLCPKKDAFLDEAQEGGRQRLEEERAEQAAAAEHAAAEEREAEMQAAAALVRLLRH